MQQQGTNSILGYGIGDGVPIRWGWTVALTIVLGLASGVAWIVVGERLDGLLGNDVAWFVCPLVFPVLLSALMSVRVRRHWKRSLTRGAVFVAFFYAAHWVPMAVVLAPYYLGWASP